MTVGVCLRCGALKHGAFNFCPKCHYTPDDDESLTKHLLITDHFLSREQLEAVSDRVKAGMPVEFPSDVLQSAWASKERLDAEGKRLDRGCVIGFVALLVLMGVVSMALEIWRS